LPKDVQKDKTKMNVEKLVYTLKCNTNVTIDGKIKDEVKFLFKRYMDDAKRTCSEWANQSLHRILK